MIVTSVQIKTAKTQKHLYCLVFTEKNLMQKRQLLFPIPTVGVRHVSYPKEA